MGTYKDKLTLQHLSLNGNSKVQSLKFQGGVAANPKTKYKEGN